jgi:predicted TIM-barrel fold metal-dependent hydrolase
VIIDSHHHTISLAANEKALEQRAEFLYATFGPKARSHVRIDVSIDNIKRELRSYEPDPHGEKLLERMAANGVDVTVICVVDNIDLGSDDEQTLQNNRAYADIAAGSHGKLIALAGIDPRRQRAAELFQHCIEDYGMRGLKWHPDDGYSPGSENAFRMLEIAQRLGVPLLTHVAPAMKPKQRGAGMFVHPRFIDDITAQFQGLKVIAAHMGMTSWQNEWAGLAQYRRNLFGDIAFWQIMAASNWDRFCRELRNLLDIAGDDSILFGSDGPSATSLMPNKDYIRMIRELPQRAPQDVKFTIGEVDKILGGNAQKVFAI